MATITLKIGQDQAEYTTNNAKLEKVVDRFVRRRLSMQNVGNLPDSYTNMTTAQKLEFTLGEILTMLSTDAKHEHRESKRREQEAALEAELKELDLRDELPNTKSK